MDKCQRRCLGVIGEGLGHFVDADRLTPVVFYHYRSSAAALHVLFHTTAKNAVLADDNRVSRAYQVDEAGLHAR